MGIECEVLEQGSRCLNNQRMPRDTEETMASLKMIYQTLKHVGGNWR
jgi:hypothetical protein